MMIISHSPDIDAAGTGMKHSEIRRQRILKLFRARELLTAALLALSLLVTYKLWDTAQRAADQTVETAFNFGVQESNERIRQRIAIYEQVLRATVGFFSAAEEVTRGEFRAYVNALSLPENFPGIQGIGFAQVIPAADLDRHVAAVRADGFPEYTVTPEGPRDMYTSIVYLEPFSGRNLRAFGFDMYSEPNRRQAMSEARDEGRPALSGKVILVQEGGGAIQWGFLMYLPVYRNDKPHSTLDERRRNLVGWVYAPFRAEDFMRGIGESNTDLDVEIYDGTDITSAGLMYDAHENIRAAGLPMHSKNALVVADRTWTVVHGALPAFDERMRSDRPQLILQAGVSISLMIALLTWLFLDDRARALQAADQALQLALYDALTGLPNRKLLDERVGQALAKARRSQGSIALLFIDLDRFKPVNDNFGHAYGDLLLKDVALRLQGCMRESDTASRLGGDEFVALLTDIDGEAAARKVADKILQRLTAPYEVAGHTFHISASIGAALYPQHGSDGKTLVRSADLAMYEAKNAGRATVRFAPPVSSSGGGPAAAG
ncbi:MAG TPA: CHASE domain-containing protein [Noviherbaspirillum sp.]|jgi:diguanylate cyclase (GGDEF)-like protein|uniref:CHASE domain-containing protein n=1 Tax=Noviherbaspirillum sp. TaxID=1926288 RepID=UPI002F9570A3